MYSSPGIHREPVPPPELPVIVPLPEIHREPVPPPEPPVIVPLPEIHRVPVPPPVPPGPPAVLWLDDIHHQAVPPGPPLHVPLPEIHVQPGAPYQPRLDGGSLPEIRRQPVGSGDGESQLPLGTTEVSIPDSGQPDGEVVEELLDLFQDPTMLDWLVALFVTI